MNINYIRIYLFDLYTLLGFSFWIVMLGLSIWFNTKPAFYFLILTYVALTLNAIDGIWRSGLHERFWAIDPKLPRKERITELRKLFILGLDD